MSQTYHQIERAVGYMVDYNQMNSSVDMLAEMVNLNSNEFCQMFIEWSGVEPETFFRGMSPNLKRRNEEEVPDLFDSNDNDSSFNSESLHNRSFKINRITADEYQNGDELLVIKYSVQQSPFGRMMVASTEQGICTVWFFSKNEQPGDILADLFPEEDVRNEESPEHIRVAGFFENDAAPESRLDLHVKGTPFQVSVWEALLRIPEGELRCCSDIAKEIGNPKALRAVGSAIGQNPIAYFIPCHRVVPAAGGFGNYRWGKTRKAAMIGWERVRTDQR